MTRFEAQTGLLLLDVYAAIVDDDEAVRRLMWAWGASDDHVRKFREALAREAGETNE